MATKRDIRFSIGALDINTVITARTEKIIKNKGTWKRPGDRTC